MKRPRHKSKQEKPRVRKDVVAGSKSEPKLTTSRKWLFRFMAFAVVPLLLLGGMEGVLRLFGYGYHTGFFKTIRVHNHSFLVNNENFCLRFFPPQLARWPDPIMMEARKPTNTFRIFILGESAARGEPEPPFSAARYLEALLDLRYPDENFEVVNTSITAINSNVILPIARDCARRQGDLWIIYMGNNEMVGPFGAATVFGLKAPPLEIIRLNLAIQQSRLGQLFMALSRKLQGKTANSSWGGMKMFIENHLPPDAPARDVVYRNFYRNLQDIVRVGLTAGAKIILNTVTVNLKDCPPFASLHATSVSQADCSACDSLYANGCVAEANGNLIEAADLFEKAAGLDPQMADVQYRWGKCLLRLTNYTTAREHLQLACDHDALPFRADSKINGMIKQVGEQFASSNLDLFDTAKELAAETTDGVCGEETFYEHVHFNFNGQFRLGRLWADQVAHFLPAAVTNHAAGDWASPADCDRRLGLTDWNRRAVVKDVIWRLHRPPMGTQFNNEWRLSLLHREDNDLAHRMSRTNAIKALNFYVEAIKRTPNDHYLYQNFAEFLQAIGDPKQALAEWQSVCKLVPYDCVAYYQTGRLLEDEGRWKEAQVSFYSALKLRPRLTEAWFELGNVYAAQGQLEQALEHFTHAWKLEPQSAVYCAFVGKALSKTGHHTEAVQRLRQAIQMEPGLWEAHFALGDELVIDGKIAEAQQEYQAVIRLQPTNVLAHLNVGVMQARQGRFADALRQFQETLHLDPGNKQAKDYYERVQNWEKHKK